MFNNMLLGVRTTVDINDDLMTELKRVAADTRRSLKDLIEDAIRASLARDRAPRGGATGQRVLTFKGRGVQPGVNLNSMRDLLDLMDGPS